MAGTTSDKLAKLVETKKDLKAALIEKGQQVGDILSTYPDAIRAINSSQPVDMVTISAPYSGAGRTFFCYDGIHYEEPVTVPSGSCVFYYEQGITADFTYIFSGSVSEVGALMQFKIGGNTPAIVFVPITSGEITIWG